MSKKLVLLGLPIGNMSDVSARLIETIKVHQFFFVEDTRNFLKFLNLLEIPVDGKVIQAFHEHSKERVTSIVSKHINTSDICVVSDAGSPVLSDPGFPLVREWINQGGRIESISGPSAALVALEVSGLPPLPFKFHGFLPKKKESLKAMMSSCESGVTHIFFESPHRIVSTLGFICDHFSELSICVVRELTKKFEEHYRFTSEEWLSNEVDIKEKGEFVVLIHPSANDVSGSVNTDSYIKLIDEYMKKPSKKSLARLFSQIKGGSVAEYYSQL